jgi:lipid-A-disaccharide synthase
MPQAKPYFPSFCGVTSIVTFLLSGKNFRILKSPRTTSSKQEDGSLRMKLSVVVFPFEKALYEQAGCPVEFVGHPLLDVLKGVRVMRRTPQNKNKKSLVALLPGSRFEEVSRLLPPMLRVAERIVAYQPCDFVLPLASTIPRRLVDALLKNAKVFVKVVTRDALSVRKSADFALVASGTATLETGLLGTPMVILYKVSRLNYWIAKRVVRISRIGLVNIVAGKMIVPEFIQDELKIERILSQALCLLQNTQEREQMKKDLASIAHALGGAGVGASQRAAREVIKIVKKNREEKFLGGDKNC